MKRLPLPEHLARAHLRQQAQDIQQIEMALRAIPDTQCETRWSKRRAMPIKYVQANKAVEAFR